MVEEKLPTKVMHEDDPVFVRTVNKIFNRRNYEIAKDLMTYVTLALVIFTLFAIVNERDSRVSTVDRELRTIQCRSIRLYPDTDPYAKSVRRNFNCPKYNPNLNIPPKLSPPPGFPRPTVTRTKTATATANAAGVAPTAGVTSPSVAGATRTNPARPPRSGAGDITGTMAHRAPQGTRTVTATRTRTPAPAPKSSSALCGILGVCVTLAS